MKSFKGTILTALLFVLPTVALFELDNQGYIVDGVIFATVFMTRDRFTCGHIQRYGKKYRAFNFNTK